MAVSGTGTTAGSTSAGATAAPLRFPQVELCNLILALALDHFALGSAPGGAKFFGNIKAVVGAYASGHGFSLPNPVFILAGEIANTSRGYGRKKITGRTPPASAGGVVRRQTPKAR